MGEIFGDVFLDSGGWELLIALLLADVLVIANLYNPGLF